MKPLKTKMDFDFQKVWDKMKQLETSVWNQLEELTGDNQDEEDELFPYERQEETETETEREPKMEKEEERESVRSDQPQKIGIRGDLNAPKENEIVVNCGYCGAENIVPRWEDGYCCYFCWHRLNQ